MDILIQGTKGGAKVFYPKPTPELFFAFAGDIRRQNSNGAIGWQIYAIAPGAQGCIFSKLIGVFDVARGFAGNVSFSFFLPKDKVMATVDIKGLLDELCDTYSNRYIADNRLDGVRENWDFIDPIVSRYERRMSQGSSRGNDYPAAGKGDEAYYYYGGDEELHRLLKSPYQEEYNDYRQILLIDKSYQEAPNSPLGAVRHNPAADLTGKVELENPAFKLAEFRGENGVEIEISAAGNRLRKGDKIRLKDKVRIRYTKRFHEDITAEGRLDDDDVARWMPIEGNSIYVVTRPPMTPIRHEVTFMVESEGDGEMEVTIENDRREQKKPIDRVALFEGEEVAEKWTVTCKVGDKTDRKTFVPKYDKIVHLKPVYRKRCEFVVYDDNERELDGCRLHITDASDGKNIATLERRPYRYDFSGDDVKRTYNIRVSKTGYEETFEYYCPEKDGDKKRIHVKKQSATVFGGANNREESKKLPVRTNGIKHALKNPEELDSKRQTLRGTDKNRFQLRRGYEFEDPWFSKGDSAFIINIREKTSHKIFTSPITYASVVALVAIAFVVWIFWGSNYYNSRRGMTLQQVNDSIALYRDSKEQLEGLKSKCEAMADTTERGKALACIDSAICEIEEAERRHAFNDSVRLYLDGRELLPEKLKEYKKSENQLDDAVRERLDSAIVLRDSLKAVRFKVAKKMYKYSHEQMSFRNALDYDNDMRSTIIHIFDNNKINVDTLTLSQIEEILTKTGKSATNLTRKSTDYDSKGGTRNDDDEKFWSLIESHDKKRDHYTSLKHLTDEVKKCRDSIVNKNNWNKYKYVEEIIFKDAAKERKTSRIIEAIR